MEIDKLFKQKLANRQADVNPNLWDKLEAKIDAQNMISNPENPASSATNTVTQSASSWLATAAKIVVITSAVGAAAVGGYFIFNNNEKEPAAQITQGNITPEIKGIDSIKLNENVAIAKEEKTGKPLSHSEILNNETPDFSSDIASSVNQKMDIAVEFSKPQKSKNESSLQNVETKIPSSVIKKEITETKKESDLTQTPINQIKKDCKEQLSSKLKIPNVITPNGDGKNDFFVIQNLDLYPENSFVIWTKSAKQVFSANNYQNNWDATNLPDGTYIYKLLLKTEDKTEIVSGIIEVIR